MKKRIIFIDSRVLDFETLIRNDVPDTSYVILDPDRSGIDQIHEYRYETSYSEFMAKGDDFDTVVSYTLPWDTARLNNPIIAVVSNDNDTLPLIEEASYLMDVVAINTTSEGLEPAADVVETTITPELLLQQRGRQPDIIVPTQPDDPDFNVPIGQYDGVVYVISDENWLIPGKTVGSGSLLWDGKHILTAAHVVCENGNETPISSENITFEFRLLDGGTVSIKAKTVYVHPDYDIEEDGNGDLIRSDNDIAIVELETEAPANADRYQIYRDTDEIDKLVTHVGYGTTGTGAEGIDDDYPTGVARYGDNTYDLRSGDVSGGFLGTDNGVLLYDFDDGTSVNDRFGNEYDIHHTGVGDREVIIAGGDSGGPAFIGGKIAGVHSFSSNEPAYGSLAGDTRVSEYAPWIDEIVNQEKIEVVYKTHGNSFYFHKYILYTDLNDNIFYARGGPSLPLLDGYGIIATEWGEYTAGSVDWDSEGDDPHELIIGGQDLSGYWNSISTAMDAIEIESYEYQILGPNSNTAVDEALVRAGLTEPQQDDLFEHWSPGSGPNLDEPINSYNGFANSGRVSSDLAGILIRPDPNLKVEPNSVNYTGAQRATSTFLNLNIGNASMPFGVLLTSGDGLPPTSNTTNSFSTFNYQPGDSDLTAIVTKVFPQSPETNDASLLSFNIIVSDLSIKSVLVDIMFGSDEYPEYSDSFVDIGAFIVNGENYAMFSNGAPLCVLDSNISAFRNNSNGLYPIEYDGISHKIVISAPVKIGLNTIKIGVADTGDSALDSGLFVSNMRASHFTNEGVMIYVNAGEDKDSNNSLTGTSGNINEFFDAGKGNDIVFGDAGNDIVLLGYGNDSAEGGDGNDEIDGGNGYQPIVYDFGISNTVTTLSTVISNDDLIFGGNGDDILTGGEGADTLDGGTGFDTANYSDKTTDVSVVLNTSIDAIVSVGGIAEDTIRNIEKLIGGSGNDSLTGDGADNCFRGSGGSDILDGGEGINTAEYWEKEESIVITLLGAADAAVYVGGVAEDTIRNIENLYGGVGDDVLTGDDANNNFYGGAGADKLSGGVGNDELNGGEDDDELNGGAGNDTLDGGSGADTMEGGIGNDLYMVNYSKDVITEKSGEGTDTIQSSVSYTLGSNIENLLLTGRPNRSGTGNTLDNTLTGNSGNNKLSGGLGNDNLYGGDGNDTLDGGSGADTMEGGIGNDLYIVNYSKDVVTEKSDEGIDTVQSSVSYTLVSNIDHLLLTGSSNRSGTGNTLANTLTGNSGNNKLSSGSGNDNLYGGAGNDTLDGGSGADTMEGGIGNDLYIVDYSKDVVTETTGEGTDTIQSSVSYTLGSNIENLLLTGSSNRSGTGNTLANTLTGNSGNNKLSGVSGNDTLIGGLGSDTLTGGSGNDRFVYKSASESTTGARDVITDFVSGQDRIDLSGIDANTGVSGNQPFSGPLLSESDPFTQAGQLRYDDTEGILYGNTDSDLEPEYAIELIGAPALELADLIL